VPNLRSGSRGSGGNLISILRIVQLLLLFITLFVNMLVLLQVMKGNYILCTINVQITVIRLRHTIVAITCRIINLSITISVLVTKIFNFFRRAPSLYKNCWLSYKNKKATINIPETEIGIS